MLTSQLGFCSPSVSLLFELFYHRDIIEFQFPPNLDEGLLCNICEHIVTICHDIMDAWKRYLVSYGTLQ